MRSRPFKIETRERIRDRAERHLYACKCPRRPTVHFGAYFGEPPRLLRGTADCSRHRCGRAMRLWLRMKDRARA